MQLHHLHVSLLLVPRSGMGLCTREDRAGAGGARRRRQVRGLAPAQSPAGVRCGIAAAVVAGVAAAAVRCALALPHPRAGVPECQSSSWCSLRRQLPRTLLSAPILQAPQVHCTPSQPYGRRLRSDPPCPPPPRRRLQGRLGQAVVPQVGALPGHAARAQGDHHADAVEPERQLGADCQPRPDVQGTSTPATPASPVPAPRACLAAG